MNSLKLTRGNMGKIFLDDFSTFPSTLRRADQVNHTCEVKIAFIIAQKEIM